MEDLFQVMVTGWGPEDTCSRLLELDRVHGRHMFAGTGQGPEDACSKLWALNRVGGRHLLWVMGTGWGPEDACSGL